MSFDFTNCPRCKANGVLPMPGHLCPNCKQSLPKNTDISDESDGVFDSAASSSATALMCEGALRNRTRKIVPYLAVLVGVFLVLAIAWLVREFKDFSEELKYAFGPCITHHADANELANYKGDEPIVGLTCLPSVPPSAKDIFICSGGRDMYVLYAVTLDTSSQVKALAKQLSGVSIDRFASPGPKAIMFDECENILKRARPKDKDDIVSWDVSKVVHGLLYEIDRFTEGDVSYSGSGGKSVYIDLDRNRLYYYFWTT
jgi:hypothetical protein